MDDNLIETREIKLFSQEKWRFLLARFIQHPLLYGLIITGILGLLLPLLVWLLSADQVPLSDLKDLEETLQQISQRFMEVHNAVQKIREDKKLGERESLTPAEKDSLKTLVYGKPSPFSFTFMLFLIQASFFLMLGILLERRFIAPKRRARKRKARLAKLEQQATETAAADQGSEASASTPESLDLPTKVPEPLDQPPSPQIATTVEVEVSTSQAESTAELAQGGIPAHQTADTAQAAEPSPAPSAALNLGGVDKPAFTDMGQEDTGAANDQCCLATADKEGTATLPLSTTSSGEKAQSHENTSAPILPPQTETNDSKLLHREGLKISERSPALSSTSDDKTRSNPVESPTDSTKPNTGINSQSDQSLSPPPAQPVIDSVTACEQFPSATKTHQEHNSHSGIDGEQQSTADKINSHPSKDASGTNQAAGNIQRPQPEDHVTSPHSTDNPDNPNQE